MGKLGMDCERAVEVLVAEVVSEVVIVVVVEVIELVEEECVDLDEVVLILEVGEVVIPALEVIEFVEGDFVEVPDDVVLAAEAVDEVLIAVMELTELVKEDCVEVLREVHNEDIEGIELDDDALEETEVEEDTDSVSIPAKPLDCWSPRFVALSRRSGSSSENIDVG
jgi:hypothetical protein